MKEIGIKKLILSLFVVIFIIFSAFDFYDEYRYSTDPIKLLEEEIGKNLDDVDIFLNLTQSQKLEDFEYLCKTIKENYLYFGQKFSYEKWFNLKDKYYNLILRAKTNKEFSETINRFMNEVSSHIYVANFFYIKYVLEVYDNDSLHEKWYSIIKNKDLVEKNISWLKYQYINNYKTYLNEIYSQLRYIKYNKEDSNFYTYELDKNIAYVQINTFSNFIIKKDRKKLFEYFKTIKDYEKIVIDLRNNSIGSSKYWKNLIVKPISNKSFSYHYYYILSEGNLASKYYQSIKDNYNLKKIENFSFKEFNKADYNKKIGMYKYDIDIKGQGYIDFNPEIFLLVGEKSSSAVDDFAYFANETGFAKVIGKDTIGMGQALLSNLYFLPNSGLTYYILTSESFRKDGTSTRKSSAKIQYEFDGTLNELKGFLKRF